jgi:pre-mRNA-splicing factor ATP-dependent RNA helicase DHX16
LTIDGIKYGEFRLAIQINLCYRIRLILSISLIPVIDTGFNKETSFNAKTGMESLMVMPISQAAAQQRAGRAGRTQPGKCFRLFTAYSFQHELDPNTTPEILRTNMCNVVLMLKSLGIDNLLAFDFMDAPPPETLIRAVSALHFFLDDRRSDF